MRAILIDPKEMTVVEIRPANLSPETMCGLVDADTLTRTGLGGSVYGYLDDEGLTRPGQRFWHFEGSKVLMGGKTLVVSADPYSGDAASLAPYATLDLTKRLVAFLGDARGAERAIQHGIVDRPMTVITVLSDPTVPPAVAWEWKPEDCLDGTGGAS